MQVKKLMERIRKIHYKNKEILLLDYTERKVPQMIEIFDAAKRIVKTENKRVLVLSLFNKNYITPAFMKHVEKEMKEVEQLIDKNAIVGLSEIQKWIFMGMKMWYKLPLHYFNSYDEALEYLVTEDTTL